MMKKRRKAAQIVVDVAKEENKTPAQVALNWVVQQPGVTSTIIGARTLAQLEDNLQCLSFTLPKEQIDKLSKETQPEPIFPHSFLSRPTMRAMPRGGTIVQSRDM